MSLSAAPINRKRRVSLSDSLLGSAFQPGRKASLSIDDRGVSGVLEQVRVHKSKVPVQPG